MKNQRQRALDIISEEQLNKFDESGLVIVSRDERDITLAKLDTLIEKSSTIKPNDDKSQLVSDLKLLLGVEEGQFVSKIRQLQQALKSFAALHNKVVPDYSLIINAKIALGEKIENPVINTNVIQARRESVYVPPRRSISTAKRNNQIVVKQQNIIKK